jgi:hypothetical protein
VPLVSLHDTAVRLARCTTGKPADIRTFAKNLKLNATVSILYTKGAVDIITKHNTKIN